MMPPPESERILIFDFGSQYGQLIARRVREQNVFCQIVRHDLPAWRVAELKPRGLIFSGGPASVYAPGAPLCDPKLFDLGIPVLGICYGMQLACQLLGGEVKPAPSREFGRAVCRVRQSDGLFADVPPETIVWMSHGDQVSDRQRRFRPAGRDRHLSRRRRPPPHPPIYGLQFHPEVSHTPHGGRILHNFLYDICGCQGLWQIGSFLRADRGGAAAAHRRPPRHLRPVRRRRFVGDGGAVAEGGRAAGGVHLRGQRPAAAGRIEAVRRTFRDHFKADLHVVEAADRFLEALEDISDPQEKRRRIGHVFIDVFKDEALHIVNVQFLAQGTLYPDVIESGGAVDGPAANIKTHHNVGGLPKELGFELIEPLQGPVQGRGTPPRPGTGSAGDAGLSPSLPRPRSGGALPRPGQRRTAGGAASGRRDSAR